MKWYVGDTEEDGGTFVATELTPDEARELLDADQQNRPISVQLGPAKYLAIIKKITVTAPLGMAVFEVDYVLIRSTRDGELMIAPEAVLQ